MGGLRIPHQYRTKRLRVALLVEVLLAVTLTTCGCLPPDHPPDQTTEAGSQPPAPSAIEVFLSSDPTEDSASAAAVEVAGSTNVWATFENGEVRVILGPEEFWDETHCVRDTADKAVDLMEAFFRHSKVSDVYVARMAEFTDPYGQSSTEIAVMIGWDRSVAERVNWDKLKEMTLGDYRAPFLIATLYYFHPAIWKNLEDTDGLLMTKS